MYTDYILYIFELPYISQKDLQRAKVLFLSYVIKNWERLRDSNSCLRVMNPYRKPFLTNRVKLIPLNYRDEGLHVPIGQPYRFF
jgi:hypothetical protein